MTKTFPFDDDFFDLIFYPVSNCYVENFLPIWEECFRILKKDGILLSDFDNGASYVFNDDEAELIYKLPFNPLKDKTRYNYSIQND